MSILPIIPRLKNYFKNKSINVIEIGTRYGESAEIILKNFNINNYSVIDPYESYEDYKIDGFNNIIKNNEDKIFYETKNKLESINTNVKFYRTYSNNISTVNNFENNSVDLIFIDANHTYQYVMEDLENYYPKLKHDGILCGDDFFMRNDINDNLKTLNGDYKENMVYEAVIDFCKKYNKDYVEYGIHAGYGKIYEII